MIRVAMLMCEHHHKLVYNTSSAPLYLAASLSGAAARAQKGEKKSCGEVVSMLTGR